MITDCYDIQTEPLIRLKDFYGEQKHLADTCLILFSKKLHAHLLETFECTEIAHITACNGNTPVYLFDYQGKKIAFYLSALGSSLAAGMCIEVNWLVGASKFIMFGSCGSLDRAKTEGRFILPTESYRGEGCSYYYAPPSDYIPIANSQKLAAIFDELGVPYVLGRVWTTESMLRETAGLVAARKAEGCIAVEMELAGVQAACTFEHLELYNFLEAGDVLEESSYEVAGLSRANHHLGKLYIALQTALRI